MSSIYDALSKQKETLERPVPAEPFVPTGTSAGALPLIRDLGRDREIEALRQRILLELPPDRTPVIVFTGSVPGEGASTLALHFARELAAEGRLVLLVDGDLSPGRDSLTGVLRGPESAGPGLTDVLAGQASLSLSVLATEEPKMHFLSRGTEVAAPLELVSPERVQRVLQEMTHRYSFVVMDAGSSLEAPEAALLSSATDGVVLVVRASRTRREVIQKAVRVLNRANCRLLGVVLNDRRYPIPDFLYRRV